MEVLSLAKKKAKRRKSTKKADVNLSRGTKSKITRRHKKGKNARDIAKELGIKTDTVRKYLGIKPRKSSKKGKRKNKRNSKRTGMWPKGTTKKAKTIRPKGFSKGKQGPRRIELSCGKGKRVKVTKTGKEVQVACVVAH